MISRDKLYDLVWSEPMIRVAERFDVSGSYLARICALLNVPRPERGYWAKLAVGKAPPQRPLPAPRPGDPLHWSKDRPLERPRPPRPTAPLRRQTEKKIRIARLSVHGLILGARTHLDNSRPVDEGAYLKPFKKLLVDVTVSNGGAAKALELANDLFNAFESVGHRVVIAANDSGLWRAEVEEREAPAAPRNRWEYSGLWSPARPTVVYIGTVAIGLAIIEMSATVTLRYVSGKYIPESEYVPPRHPRYADHSWTTKRDLPSGRMRIVAYSPYGRVDWTKSWDETKGATLRSSLRTIVAEIEAFAPDLVEKIDEADRQAELRRQEWDRQEELRKRADDRGCVVQSIKDSRSELGKIIAQWGERITVEKFLVGVEQRAALLPDEERRPIEARLGLARDFLGSQDPLSFFERWKTPVERYQPAYNENEGLEHSGLPPGLGQ